MGAQPWETRHLTIVACDLTTQHQLQRVFGQRGYVVRAQQDPAALLNELQDAPPHALLIEVGHPHLDGLGLLMRVRRGSPALPIIVITHRNGVGDRVQMLNAGADDFLGKPFDVDELDARIRAIVRRNRALVQELPCCGRLRMDVGSGAFYVDDAILELTPREQRLLAELIARAGAVVPRDRLFRAVFAGESKIGPQALDVVVHRARKKLAAAGVTLVTLRGLGYVMRAATEAAVP